MIAPSIATSLHTARTCARLVVREMEYVERTALRQRSSAVVRSRADQRPGAADVRLTYVFAIAILAEAVLK